VDKGLPLFAKVDRLWRLDTLGPPITAFYPLYPPPATLEILRHGVQFNLRSKGDPQ